MDRRDVLRIEVNELKKRLGIEIQFKKLNSIEDCRKAFVEITEKYADKKNINIKNLKEENQELKNYIEDLEADKQEVTFLLNAKLSKDLEESLRGVIQEEIKNQKNKGKKKWWLW